MKREKLIFIILTCITMVVGGGIGYNKIMPVNEVKCVPITECIDNPIKKVKNYIIYYGNDFKSVMNKFKTYDLVIINPLEEGAEEALEELHKANIKVYGYFSAVEIPSYDSEYITAINDSEKLKINNKYIKHWENNLLGDISNSSFRKKIINLIGKRIANKYDGVFIDTVDDIDCLDYIVEENNIKFVNSKTYMKTQQEGCINFFKELKNSYKDLSIIQNRGFEVLNQGSCRYVDSILYEDIRKTDDEDFYKRVKKILDEFTINNNGVVMALPNKIDFFEESRKLAESNNWLYYATTDYETSNIEHGDNFVFAGNLNNDTVKKDEQTNNKVEMKPINDKDKIVKEKIAVTKVKANLSKLTKVYVDKDITFPQISHLLLDEVEDKVISINFTNINTSKRSISFKIEVYEYDTSKLITIISAKLIFK